MATRTQRPRIPPMWRAGLRRGTVRNEATLAFLNSPIMMEKLLRAMEEMRAMGLEPMSMEGVRQFFDYAPRKPVRSRG